MHAEDTSDGNLWGLEGGDTLHGDGRNNVIYGGYEKDGKDGEYAIRIMPRCSDNDRLWGEAGMTCCTANQDEISCIQGVTMTIYLVVLIMIL